MKEIKISGFNKSGLALLTDMDENNKDLFVFWRRYKKCILNFIANLLITIFKKWPKDTVH